MSVYVSVCVTVCVCLSAIISSERPGVKLGGGISQDLRSGTCLQSNS